MNPVEFESLWRSLYPLLLAFPRLLAMFIVVPLLPQGVFPALPRTAAALALSLCVYPFVAAHMPEVRLSQIEWVALVLKEVLIGTLIGLAVGAVIWVFESVGTLIDIQAGLSNATLYDPFGGHEGGPLAAFLALLGAVLFVGCGGLYVMISLVFDSYRLWPPGAFTPVFGPAFLDAALAGLGDVTSLIVRAAAPIIVVLLLVELGVGFIGRVVPQLNTFFFVMPIKSLLAALMLALYVPYLLDITRRETGELATTLLGRIGLSLGLR